MQNLFEVLAGNSGLINDENSRFFTYRPLSYYKPLKSSSNGIL